MDIRQITSSIATNLYQFTPGEDGVSIHHQKVAGIALLGRRTKQKVGLLKLQAVPVQLRLINDHITSVYPSTFLSIIY